MENIQKTPFHTPLEPSFWNILSETLRKRQVIYSYLTVKWMNLYSPSALQTVRNMFE